MSINLKRLNNFGDDVHAVGNVDFLLRFLPAPNQLPAGLPLYVGALACPLAISSLQDLPPDFSPASICFERENLNGHSIVTVKLVIGDLEIAWLADAKDPDIWMYIDLWRKVGAVPIVLGVEEQGKEGYRIFLPAMPANAPQFEGGQGCEGELGYRFDLWESMLAYCETHGAAFPLVTEHVPPLPRPDNFKEMKYLKCHLDRPS